MQQYTATTIEVCLCFRVRGDGIAGEGGRCDIKDGALVS
ncbi:hypothetical protein ABIF90_007295 [Bradyrhizobium japonicum]